MGNTLTRDEKNYICNKLKEKTDLKKDVLREKSSKVKDEYVRLINNCVLKNPTYKPLLKEFTKTCKDSGYTVKDLDILNSFNCMWNGVKDLEFYQKESQFNFNMETTNGKIRLNIKFKLDEDTYNKVCKLVDIRSRIDNLLNMYVDTNRNTSNGLEEYYILFTTWKIKKEDRLNKVNELVEIIYKDIMKDIFMK